MAGEKEEGFGDHPGLRNDIGDHPDHLSTARALAVLGTIPPVLLGQETVPAFGEDQESGAAREGDDHRLQKPAVNDSLYLGNNVEGCTVAELAAWQLRTDSVWQEEIAGINRFIFWLDRELS